jgi:hypothetical protein
MSDLWTNEYGDPAGKGAKARQRERLTMREIPRKFDRPKKERPDHDHRPKKQTAEQDRITPTARGMRRRIIRYTLEGLNVQGIYDRLDEEHYGPASLVTIGNVRRDAEQVIKVMLDEGLIGEDDLERYRRRAAKEQRDRFKRRD